MTKKNRLIVFVVLLLVVSINLSADIGQSAIITLVFPYGARSTGMGEVGTALISGSDAAFYNPANLGIPNKDWEGGAIHYYVEPLLPAFQLPDLWHWSTSGIWQKRDSNGILHGLGINYNYLNFGENVRTNEKGQEVARFNSYEYVVALSYGTLFEKRKFSDFALGANVKYAHSALDRTEDGGIGRSFAIDVGGIWRYKFGLNVGLMLQNMGPSVYYTSTDNKDPLPFTVRLGVGYDKEIIVDNLRAFRVKLGYDLERECVRNEVGEDPDPFFISIISSWTDQKPFSEELNEIIHHMGGEITLFNIAMFRIGYLHDVAGSRKEFNYGLGFNIFNHIETNWSYIHSPRFSEARDGQWRLDFTLKRIGKIRKEDRVWFIRESSIKKQKTIHK